MTPPKNQQMSLENQWDWKMSHSWYIQNPQVFVWLFRGFVSWLSFCEAPCFIPFCWDIMSWRVVEAPIKNMIVKKCMLHHFTQVFFWGGVQISESLCFTMCYSHLVGPNPWNVFHGCYSTPQIAASLKGGKPSRKNQHRNLQTSRGTPIVRGY